MTRINQGARRPTDSWTSEFLSTRHSVMITGNDTSGSSGTYSHPIPPIFRMARPKIKGENQLPEQVLGTGMTRKFQNGIILHEKYEH